MKFTTLARRIGQKSTEPRLEKVMLGELAPTELPMDCVTWNGVHQGSKRPRQVSSRDADRGLRVYYREPDLRPTIRYQGKQQYVIRLILASLLDEEVEFRARNLCGNPACLNPLHWSTDIRSSSPNEADDGPLIALDDEWSEEEAEELVELLLTENTVTNFEEVMEAPLMEGAPPELIRSTLKRMGKEHLT